MCITIKRFSCSPAVLQSGDNEVTFTVTYDNTGQADDKMLGRIASSREEDPYVFVLGSGRTDRTKDFERTLVAGSGKAEIPATIRITAPGAGGTKAIQFGFAYGINATGDCPGKFTLIRY